MDLNQINEQLYQLQRQLEDKIRFSEMEGAITDYNPECIKQALGQVKAAQSWIKKSRLTYNDTKKSNSKQT